MYDLIITTECTFYKNIFLRTRARDFSHKITDKLLSEQYINCYQNNASIVIRTIHQLFKIRKVEPELKYTGSYKKERVDIFQGAVINYGTRIILLILNFERKCHTLIAYCSPYVRIYCSLLAPIVLSLHPLFSPCTHCSLNNRSVVL